MTRTLLLFALFLVPAFVPRCASGAEMERVTVGPGETAAVRTWLTEPDGGLQIWTSTSTSTSTAANPWCDCQEQRTSRMCLFAAVVDIALTALVVGLLMMLLRRRRSL
jgi:hypothetical protein